MEHILNIFMVILMAVLGGIPTIYITLSLPVVLLQKIYGKVKYRRSMYD